MRMQLRLISRRRARRQAAARRRRLGSVMIMVVALLVMLALVGTAYIATSTTDRSAAIQSSANTQADLLLRGIIARLEGDLASDAFSDGIFYRPAQSFAHNYDHYDAPGRGKNMTPDRDDTSPFDQQLPEPAIDPRNRNDDWMASRVPEFRQPGLYHPKGTTGAATYIWPYVSGPIGLPYEVNPLTGNVTHSAFYENPVTGDRFGGHSSNEIPVREDVRIGSVQHGNINYPALQWAEGGPWQVAADNDGDGIADGFFTRLEELGQLQGLTWYASWRVVDNAAAINLNTAWDNKASTIDGLGKALLAKHYPPTWRPYFPSNISLWDLLHPQNPQDEMYRLDEYRLGHEDVATEIYRPTIPTPYDEETQQARSDYNFHDRYDLLWMQVGRRLQVPGVTGETTTGTRRLVYGRRLPEADTLGLAAGFVVRLKNNASYASNYNQYLGHTITERALLPWSLTFRNGPQINPHSNDQPYDLSDSQAIQKWFERNFDYERNGLGTFDRNRVEFSRRALVTTVNPVADRIRAHYMGTANGPDKTGGGVPHDEMLPYFPEYLYNATTAPQLKRDQNGNSFQGYTLQGEKTPWSLAPTRASLNTAGFPELFRAYWNVMAFDRGAQQGMGMHTPFWRGERVRRQQDRNTDWYNEGFSNIYETKDNPLRMFRSPLRDNRNDKPDIKDSDNERLRLPGSQVALLRAAIAAVNTIDMRDANRNVTSETIQLYAYRNPDWNDEGNSRVKVSVTVFGYEPQPFISEVYANTMLFDPKPDDGNVDPATRNENKRGFVAVELVNPHGFEIDLYNWKLLLINRRHNRTDVPMGPDYRGSFTVRELYTFPQNVKVKGNSHLVLHNFRDPTTPAQPGNNTPTAKFIPKGFMPNLPTGRTPAAELKDWTTQEEAHEIPKLSDVISDTANSQDRGGELVLVRPRASNGQYNDDENDLNDDETDADDIRNFAPVDNFDFTGMELPADENDDMQLMHYVRKNNPGSTPAGKGDEGFFVVYPGRYEGCRKGTEGSLRQEGADVKTWKFKDATDPSIINTEPPLSPAPNFRAADNTASFNHPFENPITLYNSKWFPSSVDTYPFGGFGSVADVYRIPFIGAYTVRPLMDTEYSGARQDEIVDTNRERIYEMNGISMDSAFADDTDDTGANNKWELVGRFWPVGDFENLKPDIAPDQLDIQGKSDHHAKFDYEHHRTERARLDNAGNPLPVDIRYLWARDILDYFTVLAPHDDYAPSARKNNMREILNSDTQIAKDHGQAFVPPVTEGLININTAPLPVLSMLPFTDLYEQNVLIARQIIEYRERYGPFAHLADLMRVPALAATVKIIHTGPGENLFEWAARPLARVSNMITTRSDSFTAYVTLQGWRNAGGGTSAEMVVQRRAVVVFDRSGVIKSVNADGPRYDRGVKSMYMQLD